MDYLDKTGERLIEEMSALRLQPEEFRISESSVMKWEDGMAEALERYRSLFDNANEAIFILQNGKFVSVNRKLSEILGVPAPKLEGFSFHDYVWPEERDFVVETYRRRVQGESAPESYEFRVVGAEGNPVWVYLSATDNLEWKREPANMYLMGDISDRKHAEAELRANEEKFRSLAESTFTAIFLITDTKITYVNPAFEAITGYTLEDFADMNSWNFIHPDHQESVKSRTLSRLQGLPVPSRHEIKFITKDGRERWMDYSSVLSKFDRQPTLVVSALDITDRKEAEERLQESEQRLKDIIEFFPEAIVIIDLEGKVIAWNRAMEDLTGVKATDMLGKGDYEYAIPLYGRRRPILCDFVLHPEDKDLDAEHAVIRSRYNIMWADHFSFNLPRGKAYLSATAAGLHNSKGELIAAIECIQDNTDRKNMSDRLNHAGKMEAIGTLAGGIAHDFNNLLMGIQGHASLMMLNIAPSHPHYAHLKIIDEQVASGADLTRQLLGFARGGRLEVKPANINDIVEKTCRMFERTKKEISIHKKYDKFLWSAEVDRSQLEQVFMNLYVNAWQAMPGGGEISIETNNFILDDTQSFLYTVKEGKYVRIIVTDTGTVMDESTRERIFDPFFTTKGMGRGSGLGLATVYGIIKGHEGMIDVHSEVGQGTMFTIYLPASEKTVVTEHTIEDKILMGHETVLLVDDEPIVLEVNKDLLEALGYRVYVAGSGQEAVAVFLEKRDGIDLVILDMIMPGMTGGQTFDRLRKIDPAIRVLLLSGYSIDGEARKILERGCNGFLQKPFHLKDLSQGVREALR